MEDREKEVRKEPLSKWARSTECGAPKLNPETAATLLESAIKRNKFMAENQRLARFAGTVIGSLIDLTMLMGEEQGTEKLVFI